ncbi:sensor histidine kinase [Kineosporia sp. R_H_3]|uniref:sensor histidine kinase n=1 Tax=Kineosporia sp. R_H_3 TaxID=1961848 RepID=UPI000B4B0AC0|nr:ATP-binding protein [Kineosporia sp. R_H_3]
MTVDPVTARDTTAGPAPAVTLDAAALNAICPFHLAWDASGRVVQAGPVLRRLVPDVVGSPLVDGPLRVVKPHGLRRFEDLRAASTSARLTVLEGRDDDRLRLRGELVPSADRSAVVFFGALVVSDLETATALGLSLRDFPAHDGVADLLLMARAQTTSLGEAQELTQRLQTLNQELEDRVDERTRSLSESRDKLALYALELEDLSERLRAESREREKVEEDLRLAHRLEAVGQLAAGVAHEINTPVQFVGDNLRFLGDALGDVERVLAAYEGLVDAALARPGAAAEADGLAEHVERLRTTLSDAEMDFVLEEAPRAVRESLEGMERVSSIVRAMKEFAHPDVDRRLTDLNKAVTTTLVVARNEYRDVAEVVTDLDEDLPQVACNPGEINQVVLTLVVNAAHAVQAVVGNTGARGTITVRTRHLPGPDGGQVEIVVEDTGVGMAADVLPRIFDPFFTTKAVGQGTGQGLSMAHAIVTTRHRGRILVTSTPGEGSSFTVRLPVGA